MDLQFQEIFQRKPARPPPQSGPQQQYNRPASIQGSRQYAPSVPRQQMNSYRGNQQGSQHQNFDQNRGQVRSNFRQQGGQSQEVNQGGNRQNLNQSYNKTNQYNKPTYNNYQDKQGDRQEQPDRFRQQRSSQDRQYSNEGQSRFPKPVQQQDSQQLRSPSYQPPQQQNQPKPQFPPPQSRPPQMNRNQYQNTNQQQMMQSNMKQFFAQQFHSSNDQARGRGRGRGQRGRGRQSIPSRVQNQHQRQFPSELDNEDTKKRLQKFKPQPVLQKSPQKKSFIKKDEELSSRSISGQSEDQYSEEGDRQQSQQSGSYSRQSQQSQNRESGSEQGDYTQEEEQRSENEESQEVSEKSRAISIAQSMSKGIDDISTAAINDMCSKEQFNERLATFDSNNRPGEHSKLRLDTSRSFSIFEINRRTFKPDYQLALKRFKRSAERAEGENDDSAKDCRRSVKALVKVMSHINKQIIDADNMRQKDLAFPLPPGESAFQFIHIYDFLWDRMRQMIKDITRLSPKEKMTKEVITICEQIARFFILSINEGRKKYSSKLRFDERMNTESIIKVISGLMNSYRQSRMNLRNLIENLPEAERENITLEKVQALMQSNGIYLSPYEPELSAYSFLFSDDRKKEFYQILTVGFEDQQTQADNPLFNSEEMQKALTVHKILNEKNIQKYFDQLEKDDTDYLFACLMLKHLQKIRKESSQMLFKTHYFSSEERKQNVKSAMLSETLRKTLRFHKTQKEEFLEFIDMMDVKVQGKLLIWRNGEFNDDHYIIPEYIFNHDKNQRRYEDSQCKKAIKNPNKLSREELIRSSWKKTTYRQQIINFYLGNAVEAHQIKPKLQRQVPKQGPIKLITKQTVEMFKQKTPQEAEIQREKEAKNLSALNQMRKGLQKKVKRTKFLQKIQTEILQLYRHTDQAKIINRKKGLAIIDEWLMYYHDKMLRISFNMIENEARKKNLLRSMLKQIKTFSGIKKNFQEAFNKTPYEFVSANEKNITPERTQRGLMSGLLVKAQFKAKKISCDSFQQYLTDSESSFYGMSLNFLILTTCSNSSQNQKILFDTLLYFVHQRKSNPNLKRKQISDAIVMNRTKDKQVAYMRIFFEEQNVTLHLRLAKVNEVKSKRKAISQNSHVIQHLFGCHNLILMRENSKYQATQIILQNLQEFVSSKSRIYQGEQEGGQKYRIDTLEKIELPILLINIWRKPLPSEQGKNANSLARINKQKYPYLTNLSEVMVMEGSTDPINLPFIFRQQLKKQLRNTQFYFNTATEVKANFSQPNSQVNIQNPFKRIYNNQTQSQFCQKSLKELLRQIRVNSSVIEQKLEFIQGDKFSEIKKKFIFSFYQEYFNLCLDQIIDEASECFKNSIFFKKWPKQLILTQNVLNQKDFIKKQLPQGTQVKLSEIEEQELISNTLQSQPEYNLISQTFKEYEFIKRICEDLKMRFVGENIEPIDTKYLILDDEETNIFGMAKLVSKEQPSRQQKEKILHLTHFINTMGKYLNLFDPNKSLTDDKFQNLYSVFQEYGLQFGIFNINNNTSQENTKDRSSKQAVKVNYQIEGDSLQFFSYLIGYLMDGCKEINVLLPAGFRFRISTQEFIHNSMKNLNNVLRSLTSKKKDIFQQLKQSQNKQLTKLVLQQPLYPEISYRERDLIGSRTAVINCDSDIEDQQEEYSEEFMNQDLINSDVEMNGPKRALPYHYQTVHAKSLQHFSYCRGQLLNQLKKKVKC